MRQEMTSVLEMTKAQRKKANVSDADFKRAKAAANEEKKDLASLVGKTIDVATFTNRGEGIYTLEFTDGSTVEFSASGDDATFVYTYVTPKFSK
jgi:hypothetical protein